MQQVLERLFYNREMIIKKQYALALEDFKAQTLNNPLETEYHVYSGCINKEVTLALINRFNQEGVIASLEFSGLLGPYYINIKVEYNKEQNMKLISLSDVRTNLCLPPIVAPLTSHQYSRCIYRPCSSEILAVVIVSVCTLVIKYITCTVLI